MCMYESIYACISKYLYRICLYYELCESENHIGSVSWLLARRCACRAWKLAGCGHDSCLRQAKSPESWASSTWPAWNSTPPHSPDAPVPKCRSGGMECAEYGQQDFAVG